MTRHRRIEAAPHGHVGKHITKCPQRSCSSMEKAVMRMCEGERTSLWTTAKIKPAAFRNMGSFQSRQQSPSKTRYVSPHFYRSYLKANKVSKSEETMKVKHACNCWKFAVYVKLSKSVYACLNYSWPKLASFLRHSVFPHSTDASVQFAAVRNHTDNISRLWSLQLLRTNDGFFARMAQLVERRSLTGELSLSCARPAADGWPLMWVNRPL